MGGEAIGLEITELRLGLPGHMEKTEKKRSFAEVDPETESDENSTTEERAVGGGGSRAKSRVVGWPPVCSYRQRSCNMGGNLGEKKCGNEGEMVKKTYVKVGMDGAPFLRKLDLNAYGSYSDLSDALKKLFGCFGVGNLIGYESGNSEYVTIYEDKEGDWMLVGDVPWVMFTESCKRLRIMKASDAKDFKRQVRNLEAHFQGLAKREITQVDHGV